MESVELLENKISYNENELFYKMNPNDESINQITITFNKYLHAKIKELKPGEIYVSFQNETDIPKLIGLLLQEIAKQKRIDPNIKITFVVIINNREQEEKLAKETAEIIGINYEIVYKQELIKSARIAEQEEILKRQQELEQQDLLAKGSTQIIKEDMNGDTKKYIETNGKIYEDNEMLSIAEKKQDLLKKWLEDPIESEKITSMSQEQLDEELTKAITSQQKTHYLENADNTKDDNKLADMSNQIAHENDGKVNEELGIIENSANMENKYTTVEETRNDTFKITTPTTNEQTISKSSTNSGESYKDKYTYETSIQEEQTQEREFENIYYYDDYSNEIYNSKGELIGKLGQEYGYYIDENNNLIKDSQVIGPVENIKDMQQTKTNTNVKKRVLENPNSSGYVSFMLIALGLSIILLIYILIKLI